jgi:hypothetical protein
MTNITTNEYPVTNFLVFIYTVPPIQNQANHIPLDWARDGANSYTIMQLLHEKLSPSPVKTLVATVHPGLFIHETFFSAISFAGIAHVFMACHER